MKKTTYFLQCTMFYNPKTKKLIYWSKGDKFTDVKKATESLRQLNWIEPFFAWRILKKVKGKNAAIGEAKWSDKGFQGVKWTKIK